MTIKISDRIKLAGFILTVVVIIAGVAGSWGDHRARAEQQKENTKILKAEGCNLAKVNTTSIAVIENKLENIEKAQVDNTAAIIKAIEEQ